MPCGLEKGEMALASDQPQTITGPTAFDPGARSPTARNGDHRGGQNVQIGDKLRQATDILAAQRPTRFASPPIVEPPTQSVC